MVIKISEYNK